MPSVVRVGLVASGVVCLVATTGPAGAQSFLQSIFGIPQPQAPLQRTIRAAPPPAAPSYRAPAAGPSRPQAEEQRPARRHETGSGSYRTLCVRMCDGYYWPINHGSSRRELGRDAAICRSSCGTEARLFYHDKSSGDASTMVDLTGRTYARLPNAFRYRQQLVIGCKCKAEPWEQSELDRHRQYAALAAQASDAPAAVASGPPPAVPAVEVVAGAVVRPEPASAKAVTPAEPATVRPPATATDKPKGHAPAVAAKSFAAPPSAHDAKAKTKTHPSRVHRTPAPEPPHHRARPQRITAKPHPAPRPAPPSRIAAAPKKPAGGFGLGAGTLRWPGD